MMHVEHPKDMHGVKMVVSATLVLFREIIVFGRFKVCIIIEWIYLGPKFLPFLEDFCTVFIHIWEAPCVPYIM